MNALKLALLSILSLTASVLADDKKVIEAHLLTTNISNDFPPGVKVKNKPYGYTEGASLTFFFSAKNLIGFEEDSFSVKGWDKTHRTQIAADRSYGTIQIFNKKFRGIPEELEAEGSIIALLGSEEVTKKLILKVGDGPVKLPIFSAELELTGDKNRNNSGVRIIGNHKSIKSISITRDGKTVLSDGYSSNSKEKTFYIPGIKDGDEVTITYWKKITTKTINLYK